MKHQILSRGFLPTVFILAVLGCTKENSLTPNSGEVPDIPFITVSLNADPVTRTNYAMDGNNLKTSWAAGDRVAITPALWQYFDAGVYVVSDPGSATSVFTKEQAVGSTNDTYGVFYPGDKIKSTAQFSKFYYTGQVQKKSDPMGHIGSYHSMRTSTSDYTTISFSSADQSSCLKMTLSGMTFHNPVKIEIDASGASCFYKNNSVPESYTYSLLDQPGSLESTDMLSMELEGYGDETSIEAWMMMSNKTVTLQQGTILRVFVWQQDGNGFVAKVPISATTSLSGGKWHDLKVRNGWAPIPGDFTDYEWDGDVVTLQEGIDGLDLIIMGDGFIKEDFDNGTYEQIMRQACDEFFSVEPLKSFREDVNVYYVKVVSPERVNAQNTGTNGANNTGTRTKFSTKFTANSTALKGNNDLVREYALKALATNGTTRIKNATIVVMVNQACRAGTCHTSWTNNNGYDYGQACSIAYCALGQTSTERQEIMRHEICGHGFGLLADEYYYEVSGSLSTSLWRTIDSYHSLGLRRNVDKYVESYMNVTDYPITTTSNVYWHDLFGTSNNYESPDVEALGLFKGANTYSFMFCRPTEDGSKSIMNGNRGIFNAISRRQIYYRYLCLSGAVTTNQYGTSTELQRFLAWDAEHCLPGILQSHVSQKRFTMVQGSGILPLSPPVLVSGHWDDGKFIADNNNSVNLPIANSD